jgi:hypothetical protein
VHSVERQRAHSRFSPVLSSIPFIDRIHGIGVNAVGTINKSKADQPILFESDLRKDDFVGRIGGKEATGVMPG